MIGYNDGKIAALVDGADGLCHTIQQKKVFWFAEKAHIAIDGPVPVQKDRTLAMGQILTLHHPVVQVLLNGGNTLRCSHVLYIFR
ncbi:hypothetical protein SDC9_139825 [bioreactor metagenome]|uniref:Uncharacterized protein n=1 Tax=bioreactor metagenome TaxID=1076179 RepID=A0A645DT74_9ZZZZ